MTDLREEQVQSAEEAVEKLTKDRLASLEDMSAEEVAGARWAMDHTFVHAQLSMENSNLPPHEVTRILGVYAEAMMRALNEVGK